MRDFLSFSQISVIQVGKKKIKADLSGPKGFFGFLCLTEKYSTAFKYIYIYIKWSNTYSVTRGLDGEDKEDKKI